MASGPITLWQIERETVETGADLIFLECSKINQSLHMVTAAMKLKDSLEGKL